MSKGNYALGKQRGKMGGVVLRSLPGVGQVMSEYQPKVANPRTLGQTKQRSKMNLAGLLSKLTPYVAIAGLNPNKRIARSEFVSQLLKVATITGDGTSASPFIAAVPPADIVFSKGVSGNFGDVSITYNANDITFLVDNAYGDDPNFSAALCIAIVSENGVTKDVAFGVGTVPSGQKSFTCVVTSCVAIGTTGYNVDCYLVPILKVEGATGVSFDPTLNYTTDTYNVSVARTLASVGAYGGSFYAGKANSSN